MHSKEMWARCLVYLDKQRIVRNAVLLLWISVASFALFSAISLGLIGVSPIPSVLWDRILPVAFLLIAIASVLGIATMFLRYSHGFWPTVGLALGSIVVGALLISMVIMRAVWFAPRP